MKLNYYYLVCVGCRWTLKVRLSITFRQFEKSFSLSPALLRFVRSFLLCQMDLLFDLFNWWMNQFFIEEIKRFAVWLLNKKKYRIIHIENELILSSWRIFRFLSEHCIENSQNTTKPTVVDSSNNIIPCSNYFCVFYELCKRKNKEKIQLFSLFDTQSFWQSENFLTITSTARQQLQLFLHLFSLILVVHHQFRSIRFQKAL